ncbi:unnamed protein product [Mytilus coruscus]|uniref:MULE transposase domain-containing protein n=1 Tax=Mytilus coruscus TaxID=42192 RepID=A0A6J7ZZ87_MYTCO|nr:unnamed protein product [Mytilus coruscus]
MSDTEQSHNTDETKEVASTSTNDVDTLNSSFLVNMTPRVLLPPSTYQLPNGQNINATQLLSIMLDQQLVVVDSIPTGFKDNVYCVLDNTNNVVTLNRYYTPLKRDKSYKKRGSWFSNLSDTLTDLRNTAVAEYSGVAPRKGVPHGNAQHSSQEYVRTDPNVIDKVKEGLSHKQSCSEIYKNMVLDSPESAPRDHHQIRNLDYNQKKQHKSAPLGNIADEIVHIFSLVNNTDFVKEVVYTEGNNKPPSIICYTKDMMKDMTPFLKSDNDRILGVDRTFNLGAVFVTNFVYKNTKVIRKETVSIPYSLVNYFWEGSYLNYHTFFSHVKARIQESVRIIDLRIGSDDESGLTKALDDVFPYPGTTLLLCTKHMKDNVSDHLKNSVGCNDKDRLQIIDKIFGSTGLVTTDDSVEFDLKSKEIVQKYPQFATYFNAHLKDRLFDHVSVPMKQLKNQDRLWTNNNCESINHVFKKSINWKTISGA